MRPLQNRLKAQIVRTLLCSVVLANFVTTKLRQIPHLLALGRRHHAS